MKTELNKKNNQTTVVIDVSYEVENNVARDFVRDEHATVFFNLKDKGIHRFEWYLNEKDKTGTLIEIFENSQVWEIVGNKLIGSPINLRLRELFTIEKNEVAAPKFLQDCKVLIIKSPSIPGDKYIVE